MGVRNKATHLQLYKLIFCTMIQNQILQTISMAIYQNSQENLHVKLWA